MYATPILFIIFNQPNHALKVFNEIKQQQPKFLFIAADAPRLNKQGEVEICKKTKELIINQIDWDCELKTLFLEKNLGPGKAVSTFISWFFEHVEQGIILEHDCMPHPDFFEYCEELLDRYKDKNNIKFISGNDFQKNIQTKVDSYYFSKYNYIWGWASWRRVWSEYDFYMHKLNTKQFAAIIKSKKFSLNTYLYWLDKFWTMKSQWFEKKPPIPLQKLNTWDYQLLFSIWRENGVCIVPNVNLVSNIGFGEQAVHTTSLDSPDANMPVYEIMPLKHPVEIVINQEADESIDKFRHSKPLWKTVLRCSYHAVYYICARIINSHNS